jgi:Tfp pilus assembly protein PilF
MPSAPRAARAWAALAAVLALALYAPTIRHRFAYDDAIVIVKNRLIRSVASLPALVTRTEWSGGGMEFPVYRPLTGVTYALNFAVSGLEPWSYHLANALLHACVAALVFALGLALRFPPRAAGVAALLFAVHPIHVEAVSSVIGRKDALATLLLVAMAAGHARARTGRAVRAILPVLCYAGAMLAKEIGVVGIALVALQDLLWPAPEDPTPAPRPRRALLYGGYAVAALLYLAAYRAVVSPVSGIAPLFVENPAAFAPALARMRTAVAVLGKGLLLQLLPVNQSPDYSYAAIPTVDSWLDLGFLSAAALATAWASAGIWLRRRAPVVLWSFGWYVAALLPVSNLLFPIGTIFGERFLYLPSVALAVLAGAALDALGRRAGTRSWAVTLATAGVLLAFSVATVRYSAAWCDDETLFRRAVESQPRAVRARVTLARLAVDRDPEEALAHARRAVELSDRSVEAELALASALQKLGRAPEQEEALRRALAIDPGNAEALNCMGRLARDAGRLDEAGTWWHRAVEASPGLAPALADLATWHLLRGESEAALAFGLRAVEANPDEASAWYDLGLLHRARGDAARSRAAFERFVAVGGASFAAEVAATREMLAREAR